MDGLSLLLLVALFHVAVPNVQTDRSPNVGSSCRQLCKRSISRSKPKELLDVSCREICLRQGRKLSQTFHRSRRGVEKQISSKQFKSCDFDRLRGNSSHPLRQLADNVRVTYGKDVAYVSWDFPSEMPSNLTWEGYAIRWHTMEGTGLRPQFCKLYSKNQTNGTIHNGHGWNSAWTLRLNVVLLPEASDHSFDFKPFPRGFTDPPVDDTTQEPPTRSRDNLLFAAVGGAIGGVVLIAVVVIIAWYFRPGDNGYEDDKPENDVFITYSRKNEEFVSEKLVPLLDNYNIRYQIDFIDFEPGVPWMENLTNCIQNSQKVLIVMSSTYLESINCKKELQEALNFNKLSSLIVLRIDSVSNEKFPKAIKNRTFIDYYSELERKYWGDRVIEAIKCTNNNRLVRFFSRSVSRDTETSLV